MAEFRWKCLILDDQLFQRNKWSDLLSKRFPQMDVVAAPNNLQGKCDPLEALTEVTELCSAADIILMDMSWFGGKEKKDRTKVTELFNNRKVLKWSEEDLKLFFSEFAQCSDARHSRDGITNAETGLWLAAAISRSNPTAIFIFFTDGSEAIKDYFNNPHSYFSPPLYNMIDKNAAENDIENTLVPPLVTILALNQQQVLLDSSIKEWIYAELLLPLVLKSFKDIAECSCKYRGDTLVARTFLPQIDLTSSEKRNENIRTLKDLLTSSAPAVRETAIDNADLDHRLGPVRAALISKMETGKKIVKARDCITSAITGCNGWANGVYLSILQNALSRSDGLQNDEILAHIQETVTKVSSMLTRAGDARTLMDMCTEMNGRCRFSDNLPEDIVVEMNLVRLSTVLNHLQWNCKKYNIGCETSPQFDVRIDEHEIVFRYQDNSIFKAISENGNIFSRFGEIILKSIKKGATRGLPLIIGYPFEVGVTYLSVLLNEEWFELYRTSDTSYIDREKEIFDYDGDKQRSFALIWAVKR